MIKFFRKIRQQLLNEGSTTKYLAYAFGEIILVVIGILIALNINNRNTERLEIKEEKLLLLNLKSEFESNNNALRTSIDNQDSVYYRCISYAQFFGPSKNGVSKELFENIIANLMWTPRYEAEKGVMSTILSSGKLSLIRNKELAIRLSSISRHESVYENGIVLFENLSSEIYISNILEKYPLMNISIGPYKGVNQSSFDSNQENILQSLTMENILRLKIIYSKQASEQGESLLKVQEETLNLINTELIKRHQYD